jgi:transposase
MERIPKAIYTPEFRAEAVALVLRDGLKASEAARRLAISKKTLDNWLMRAKAGKLADIGSNRAPVSEQEAEISRLRKELAETRMERDLLKKAAAYFARESLPGTRS